MTPVETTVPLSARPRDATPPGALPQPLQVDPTDCANPPEAGAGGWQSLPRRARTLFVLGDIIGMLVIAVLLLVPIGLVVDDGTLKLVLAGACLLVLPAGAAWWAGKRYRYTAWRFDADGFALRTGRLWRQETRVSTTRVQHLDLKRGPLERRFRLSTLVIHTAGTRHSAVSIAGLDVDDAERLRDALARQRDDDADGVGECEEFGQVEKDEAGLDVIDASAVSSTVPGRPRGDA